MLSSKNKDKDNNARHPIDVYVGGRMRLRRTQLGLSQGTLASKTGVSFQAIQKYEAGDIRSRPAGFMMSPKSFRCRPRSSSTVIRTGWSPLI